MTREVNHLLSELIDFFLIHPWVPGHFCTAVCAVVFTADVMGWRRKKRKPGGRS